MKGVTVGVLALQGAFREHRRAFERLGAAVREVRLPEHLTGLCGLVIPGGESTTMAKLMRTYGLDEAIVDFHARGGAIWGTCAGAIVVAREIEGRPEQLRLGLLDVKVARNAYGRQVASFEAEVPIAGMARPFPAVFIRAPRITGVGEGVEVLAEYAGDPVMAAQGRVLASVFHPELSGDDRVHARFLELATSP
ncbi:pyridoxal 5'-phosphate synthase glutaminase subunit PdxT [Truepera radiovictrix]|uniref:Pyridoxal 5'-phosphate synthase subunit PdxT n=1 Tax=Truepera radiovictrix (strain DSM 17093 / CIP 108686 / LMG 22925 / RQ-24) TaxID=649638 RepID=D7CRD2_TRURR|nr:pyridoxal 5'-phosphate synthase glutaminase subunit PdxT [Truepera radiovictrix]ADI15220.1 SNO glutamine amidotransferase [Truepera radiovictrix DSM 17093]WMT56229.1 pyridoxal 5'-phosphate synthase glutaminase subunit PdxT [Truepera radiovictrix]